MKTSFSIASLDINCSSHLLQKLNRINVVSKELLVGSTMPTFYYPIILIHGVAKPVDSCQLCNITDHLGHPNTGIVSGRLYSTVFDHDSWVGHSLKVGTSRSSIALSSFMIRLINKHLMNLICISLILCIWMSMFPCLLNIPRSLSILYFV